MGRPITARVTNRPRRRVAAMIASGTISPTPSMMRITGHGNAAYVSSIIRRGHGVAASRTNRATTHIPATRRWRAATTITHDAKCANIKTGGSLNVALDSIHCQTARHASASLNARCGGPSQRQLV